MKLLQIVALAFTGLLAGCAGNTAGGSVSAQTVAPETPRAQTAAPETPRTQVSAGKLEPNVQKLKKQLNLTEQQTQQLNQVILDTNAQRRALTDQQRTLHIKSMDLQKNKLERINAILTPEQAKKYEQIISRPPPEVMKAYPSLDSEPGQPTK
jgi:Spy/CpxP family protein refolding chaperone